jgi:hypothetical protein
MAKKTSEPQSCGWCIDGFHDSCKPFIEYEGRRWDCGCFLRSHKKRKG